MWYAEYMAHQCNFELDQDGQITCSICGAMDDDMKPSIFESQIDFEWYNRYMTNFSVDKKDLNEMLLSTIKNKEVLHIKNFIDEFLLWEDFISIINYQYHNTEAEPAPDKVINKRSNKPTKISKYTEFHYHLSELTYSTKQILEIESQFPKIQEFMDYIRESVESRATLKALVNFVGNEFSGNKHDDLYHVFSVQHVGTVEYNIFDSEDNKTTYTLEPGDLIFMPSGTIHAISAPTSRGTLILDIDQYN